MFKAFVLCNALLFFSLYSNATEYIESVIEAEKRYGIPFGLMQAISKAESNNHPWTLNVNSIPMFFNSRQDLVDTLEGINTKKYFYKSNDGYFHFFTTKMLAVNDAKNNGIQERSVKHINIASTDICGMQLNYKWQNSGFSDVVEMTDIDKCTNHAAKYLSKLISSYGISKGTGCYHYCKSGSKKHKTYVQKIRRNLYKLNPQLAKVLSND